MAACIDLFGMMDNNEYARDDINHQVSKVLKLLSVTVSFNFTTKRISNRIEAQVSGEDFILDLVELKCVAL